MLSGITVKMLFRCRWETWWCDGAHWSGNIRRHADVARCAVQFRLTAAADSDSYVTRCRHVQSQHSAGVLSDVTQCWCVEYAGVWYTVEFHRADILHLWVGQSCQIKAFAICYWHRLINVRCVWYCLSLTSKSVHLIWCLPRQWQWWLDLRVAAMKSKWLSGLIVLDVSRLCKVILYICVCICLCMFTELSVCMCSVNQIFYVWFAERFSLLCQLMWEVSHVDR